VSPVISSIHLWNRQYLRPYRRRSTRIRGDPVIVKAVTFAVNVNSTVFGLLNLIVLFRFLHLQSDRCPLGLSSQRWLHLTPRAAIIGVGYADRTARRLNTYDPQLY